MSGAKIYYLECMECGHVAMSFDWDRVNDKADFHRRDEPDHDLYVHTFHSDDSRKV